MTPPFGRTKSTGWAWDTFHSSQNTNNSLAKLMKSKEITNCVFDFWLGKGVRFTTYRRHPDYIPSGRQHSQMEELGHTRNLGFIPKLVLMYPTLASELISVSSISLRNTYAAHSSCFPQVAHSRSMPVSSEHRRPDPSPSIHPTGATQPSELLNGNWDLNVSTQREDDVVLSTTVSGYFFAPPEYLLRC